MPKTRAPTLTSRLSTEAAALDMRTFTLSVPIHVLLGEAVRAARFTRDYWLPTVDPRTSVQLRPGLGLIGGPHFSASIADEMLALHDLVQREQTAHVLATASRHDTTARARIVLDELRTVLQWRCDETRIDDAHTELATLAGRHRDDPEGDEALADALADYLDLATTLQSELAAIAAFDPRHTDDAARLVVSLRRRPTGGRTTEAIAWWQERNRWAALLIQRLSLVRAAARYVFRHHDEIALLVASPYERHAARRGSAIVETRAA